MSLLILILVINAISHYVQISNNQFINYRRENAISASLIIAAAVVVALTSCSYIAGFTLILCAPALRWIVHDLTLNYLRGLRWDYIGHRSKIDRYLHSWQVLTSVHFIWLKLFALMVSVALALILRYYASLYGFGTIPECSPLLLRF